MNKTQVRKLEVTDRLRNIWISSFHVEKLTTETMRKDFLRDEIMNYVRELEDSILSKKE